MGYATDFGGEILIDPPLDNKTLSKVEDLMYKKNMRFDVTKDYLSLTSGIRYHNYVYDLRELIKTIFAPDDYELNGEISFSEHEDRRDSGIIEITDNVMSIEGHYYEKGNTWSPYVTTPEQKINLLSRESPDISTSSSSTSNQENIGVSKISEVIQSTTLSASEIDSIILLLNEKKLSLQQKL